MPQHKPRFNRSSPVVKSAKGGKNNSGRITKDQAVKWGRINHETLGYLAATNKINVVQVHSLVGETPTRKFVMGFLDAVDLIKPTERDMRQINLYHHLLFF